MTNKQVEIKYEKVTGYLVGDDFYKTKDGAIKQLRVYDNILMANEITKILSKHAPRISSTDPIIDNRDMAEWLIRAISNYMDSDDRNNDKLEEKGIKLIKYRDVLEVLNKDNPDFGWEDAIKVKEEENE